jgi:hypothetical protein
MDLEKFWLGNVNEKGDVDQDGYDAETLQIVNTKVSCLKEKLVDGVVDEKDTQPQDTDADDVPLQKSADAIDYYHEVDTAEDDAAAADLAESERNYKRAQLAFQSSTISEKAAETSKRAIDEDYDDESGEEEAQPAKVEQHAPAVVQPEVVPAEQAPAEASSQSNESGPQAEQKPKTDAVRKHGLLLFSEMFLFPSIQPRIARARFLFKFEGQIS